MMKHPLRSFTGGVCLSAVLLATFSHETSAQQLASLVTTKASVKEQPQAQPEQRSLSQVLKTIEQQFQINLLYKDQLIRHQQVALPNLEGQSAERVLHELLTPLQLQANFISEGYYTITPIQPDVAPLPQRRSASGMLPALTAPQLALQQPAAQRPAAQVSGQVTDAAGEGIPGVNVLEKGTTNGTITDIEGRFVLNVSDNATLVFSAVGYLSQEAMVGSQTSLSITLEDDVKALEEVVVVGYGTTRKSDITGAVSSVGAKEIVARGTTSPMAALQGQVAGVNITSNTGLPGSGFNINIRGVNSLSSSGGQPLFVVDGVMTDNINFLNPMDIERIDILKDASSTAIYGSRGSNGVVIVTTKSGTGLQGKTQFSYQGYVGMRTIANMPDFLDAEEGVLYTMNRDIHKKLYRGDALTAPDDLYGFPSSGDDHAYWLDVINNKKYYDWTGEMLKPSVQTNHFISAAGGSDKVSFLVGAGYQGENGNIKSQNYQKFNFKGRVDANVTKQWSMGANINLAYTDRELRSENAMRQLFRMPLYTPAYDDNGEWIQVPMRGISGNVSPIGELMHNKFNTQQYYLISNFYLDFKPIDWISLKSTFSPNTRFTREGTYWDPAATKSGSGAQMSNAIDFSYIWDNQLHAGRQFGAHRIDYDFIYSMQLNRYEYLYGYGWDLPFNSEFYNLGSANFLNTASSFQKSTLMSYTNRVNYSFLDKYILTATARWDGSSKLAPGHKWAFFPSAAVAWRVSEEDFLRNISAVNNLKLRLSYGYTGNNNINPYVTQFAVNTQTYYDWNGNVANGFRPSAIANKQLTWERTREWNLGVDFGLLNNRISGEVNIYDRLSLDLLMERKLAVPTGWASMMDNVGSVSNKGIEVQLRTINVRTKDFSWETNFTFSSNRNAIVELYGKKEDDVPNRWFIGEPVQVVYAMEFDGVWQKDELAEADRRTLEGTAKVKDLNGDGVIDIDNDMRVLGSPLPTWMGGLSTTFRYKGFDLTANVYTKQGVFIYSPFHREFTDFNSKQILDVPYYVRDNPITEARYSNTYPQPTYQGQYWGEDAEDYGYPGFNKDASFVRLQNVTLGYTLPASALERIGIADLRVYVNALNPYVWTKYEGFDPEWGGASMSGENANSTAFSIYQLGTTINF
ncbi:TonB-linked outer membrane protein, SusC/RagA family [Catalinimonas alkaloidigena]|uniref:TonB-linked outer membrane protein, SusC/RagA family n=1 Tax=Catalinimonas alkaloidigena TaxID=1075417 RepID=A0A1G9GTN7_9BACT|nr:TonB-dependent receptor [Catalinimonas alkaloidigena]SDL03998.1 TonB-linked outer membrane protein, SusC/RagA family [Catalinimonas alkaloidigena]